MFYANKDEGSSVLNLDFSLKGSGEQIGLWDPDQNFLDSLTYGEQTTDVSYGRYPDGTDNWDFMTNFTPGAANQNPAPPPVELYINEFMASNDSAFPGPQGDYPDWIEIYNPGNEDVDLSGYYMSDDLADTSAWFQIPDTYPDSVTVPAGGYILFYANKKMDVSVLNLGFKLKGSGEQVGLWSPDMVVLDSITYGEQYADTSYGRYPDGTDSWDFMPDYTPGASNTNPNPGPGEVELYINEFMASNDEAVPGPQGDYPDWIEIYNAGSEAVNLGGYYMADDLSDPGAMYQIPDTYPDSVTVPAGGFIVFYANKNTDVSVLNLGFKLSGGGEQVGLWDPSQNILDSITYGPQMPDTSYGRYPDGGDAWYFMETYTPGAPNVWVGIKENKVNASLMQNFPNPFAGETNINFSLDNADQVNITVYDVTGAKVSVITNQKYSAGNHSVKWDASNLNTGYYFYRLTTSKGSVVKKAIIIK